MYLLNTAGEPNNFKSGTVPEDCGEMVPGWSYRWNDKRCNIEQLYICKKAGMPVISYILSHNIEI